MEKIDTHLHLLYPDQLSYPWVSDLPALQSQFSLDHYHDAAADCAIAGAVFMEVDVADADIAAELRMVADLARNPQAGILGIVCSARPESEDFGKLLDAVAHPLLKGVRRILHVHPDALSQSPQFRAHVRCLAARKLSFDVCALARQLPLVIDLVDACPQVSFILDHCAVPDIASGAFEPWASRIGDLARRDNVVCKISGLPTYCQPGLSGADVLRPWVERVITVFGWERVIWGGDWPVCTLNSSLQDWCDALDAILAAESESNLQALYSTNARRVYRL